VAVLFAGLLGAPYVSPAVRLRYPVWMRGVLYVLLGWFCAVGALSGFAGGYDMGLLLLCGILPVVVALGAESMGPVWRFLGIGFLLGMAGAALSAASAAEALALAGSLATVALVEGAALQGQLAAHGRLERRSDLFERAQKIAGMGPGNMTPSPERCSGRSKCMTSMAFSPPTSRPWRRASGSTTPMTNLSFGSGFAGPSRRGSPTTRSSG